MKEKILRELINNKDKLITGTYIAEHLNITRSYVSKVINEFISSGHVIDIQDRSGYIYRNSNKHINITKKDINHEINNIYILDKVDSTNKYLKELANNGENEITVVIAKEQIAGRGRLGRSFVSNSGKGIYMSILLRPTFGIELSKRITSLTATAVSEAIDEVTKLNTKIKWVNDIYVNDKKLAGILTEGHTNFESGKVEYIVVGIGINLYKQIFPDNLDNIITTVEDETNKVFSINEIIESILNKLIYYYENIKDNIHINEYRKRSYVINKNVELNIHGNIKYGKVLDIDDEGELIVLINDKKETIYSGEITKVRLKDE